jgi:hypothetical protein
MTGQSVPHSHVTRRFKQLFRREKSSIEATEIVRSSPAFQQLAVPKFEPTSSLEEQIEDELSLIKETELFPSNCWNASPPHQQTVVATVASNVVTVPANKTIEPQFSTALNPRHVGPQVRPLAIKASDTLSPNNRYNTRKPLPREHSELSKCHHEVIQLAAPSSADLSNGSHVADEAFSLQVR